MLSITEIKAIAAAFDTNKNGTIEMDEFTAKFPKPKTKSTIRAAQSKKDIN